MNSTDMRIECVKLAINDGGPSDPAEIIERAKLYHSWVNPSLLDTVIDKQKEFAIAFGRPATAEDISTT